jgi:hypothetical protein
MQAQIEIGFDQLVKIAKELPPKDWVKLKEEVEAKPTTTKDREEFIEFLLNGPTYSKKQLREIAKTRKAINQWRTK